MIAWWPGVRHIWDHSEFPYGQIAKDRSPQSGRQPVTIPRLLAVAGPNKPPRWNRWSAAEKLSISPASGLTACTSISRGIPRASIPTAGSARQVIRVVGVVAARPGTRRGEGANASGLWRRRGGSYRQSIGFGRSRSRYGENKAIRGSGAKNLGRERSRSRARERLNPPEVLTRYTRLPGHQQLHRP
jgi:hypothetical protein